MRDKDDLPNYVRFSGFLESQDSRCLETEAYLDIVRDFANESLKANYTCFCVSLCQPERTVTYIDSQKFTNYELCALLKATHFPTKFGIREGWGEGRYWTGWVQQSVGPRERTKASIAKKKMSKNERKKTHRYR